MPFGKFCCRRPKINPENYLLPSALITNVIPVFYDTERISFGIFIDENLRWQTHIDKLSIVINE